MRKLKGWKLEIQRKIKEIKMKNKSFKEEKRKWGIWRKFTGNWRLIMKMMNDGIEFDWIEIDQSRVRKKLKN